MLQERSAGGGGDDSTDTEDEFAAMDVQSQAEVRALARRWLTQGRKGQLSLLEAAYNRQGLPDCARVTTTTKKPSCCCVRLIHMLSATGTILRVPHPPTPDALVLRAMCGYPINLPGLYPRRLRSLAAAYADKMVRVA